MQGTEKYISTDEQDIENKRREYIKEKENYFIKFENMSAYRENLNLLNTEFYESYKKLHDKRWEYYDAYINEKTTKIITTPIIGQENNLTSHLANLRNKAEIEAITSFEENNPTHSQNLLLQGKTIFDKKNNEKEIEKRRVQTKADPTQNEGKSQNIKSEVIEPGSKTKTAGIIANKLVGGAIAGACIGMTYGLILAPVIGLPTLGLGAPLIIAACTIIGAAIGTIGAIKEVITGKKTEIPPQPTSFFNNFLTNKPEDRLAPAPSC